MSLSQHLVGEEEEEWDLHFNREKESLSKANKIVPDERRRPNTQGRMMNDCSFFVPVRTMGGNITRLHNYWWHRQANWCWCAAERKEKWDCSLNFCSATIVARHPLRKLLHSSEWKREPLIFVWSARMVASNESRDHDDHPALILAIVDHSCAQAAAPTTWKKFSWAFFSCAPEDADQQLGLLQIRVRLQRPEDLAVGEPAGVITWCVGSCCDKSSLSWLGVLAHC